MKTPTCPDCGGDNVRLDALCAWDGAGWVHDSDCGEMYCQDCESSFPEESIVWVVSNE